MEEKLLQVASNTDRMFFCVLTNFSVRIWLGKVSRHN
jgi:hypothetical protein